MSSVVASNDRNTQLYNERMDQIQSYMRHRRFPMLLRRKVRRYFQRFFHHKTCLDEQAILSDLEARERERERAGVTS